MTKSDLIDFAATLITETDKAVLIDDGDKKVWLPKSMIDMEKNKDGTVTITMPSNLAVEKGISGL